MKRLGRCIEKIPNGEIWKAEIFVNRHEKKPRYFAWANEATVGEMKNTLAEARKALDYAPKLPEKIKQKEKA